MFFAKHPRTLMGSEQLARLLGNNIGDIDQSLDRLLAAGLLTRAQHPPRPPRMYVFVTDASAGEWLPALVEFASTREGRLALRRALGDPDGADESVCRPKPRADASAAGGARPFLVRPRPETLEQREDQPERGER